MEAPITGVWEVTMGCNMRCKHCGSSCTTALADELTTDEALALCDAIAALGLKWITLSGGEPLLRPDWPQLIKRLRDKGVVPNIISNGWLCSEQVIETARDAGVGTFAISIDGPQDVHDHVRMPGAFDRATKAFQNLKKKGVEAGAITTVHRLNIERLDELYATLLDIGVDSWQVQMGLPMGNLGESSNRNMMLGPESVDRVIDFIYTRSADSRMRIYPADCLGYYNRKEVQARSRAFQSDEMMTWQGCTAGKRSLGILHNGDVVGCTSIRDRKFIEDNIRRRSLAEIWNDPQSFAWSRGLNKHQLQGHCGTCGYGSRCLGGCPNTRLTINGTIYSENQYCSYNMGLKKAAQAVSSVKTGHELQKLAQGFVAENELQLASIVLTRWLEVEPTSTEANLLNAKVASMLGNTPIVHEGTSSAAT